MDKDSKLSPSTKNEFPIIMALFVMFFTLIMWMGFGVLFASAVEKLPFEKYGLSEVERYIAVHTPYLLMFTSLFLGSNLILKTNIKTLISGSDKKYRYKLSLLFGGIYLVCLAILSLLSIKTIELDPASFGEKIKYLIPVLIFTPMQAISEEVFYRALPARMVFKDRMPTKRYEIVALSIFSGLFFITPHLKNPEVIQNIEYLSALAYYFVWGALSMAIGIYTGGFEIPVAMHIVNNLYIALIVNYEGGAMPTHALFINRSTTPSNWIMVLEALVIFAILFIAAGIQKKKEKKGN